MQVSRSCRVVPRLKESLLQALKHLEAAQVCVNEKVQPPIPEWRTAIEWKYFDFSPSVLESTWELFSFIYIHSFTEMWPEL